MLVKAPAGQGQRAGRLDLAPRSSRCLETRWEEPGLRVQETILRQRCRCDQIPAAFCQVAPLGLGTLHTCAGLTCPIRVPAADKPWESSFGGEGRGGQRGWWRQAAAVG